MLQTSGCLPAKDQAPPSKGEESCLNLITLRGSSWPFHYPNQALHSELLTSSWTEIQGCPPQYYCGPKLVLFSLVYDAVVTPPPVPPTNQGAGAAVSRVRITPQATFEQLKGPPRTRTKP